jgi:hypothetical protein
MKGQCMSRTTTALKRLGVSALAAVTVFGVAPAFTAPAAANHTVTGIELTPDQDTSPTGSCNNYTAQVTFSQAGSTATVDVQLAPRASGQTVAFCTLSTDGTTSVPGAGTPTNDGQASTETAEFVTNNDGQVTFGVFSNDAGVVDVTAFIENVPGTTGTDNNRPDGNEPRDTSVQTFTTGGAGVVTNLDAEPESAVNVQGDTHEFTARLTQSDGQPVPNVNGVKYRVTSGPDAATAAVACTATPQNGTTDQTGTVSCSLTNNGGPGTDNITVFLDRDNDGVVDSTEPSDDITKTFQAPQQVGTTVELTCESVRTNTAGDQCVNPLSENTEKFTATVRNAAGAVVTGAAVSFSITNQTNDANGVGTATNPDREVVTPTSCQTDANGQCSTTLTNPVTNQDETVTVTARIVTGPGSTNVTDSATKTWRNPTATEARNINLTPETQNASVPGVAPLTATVTDRLGNAVPGVQVTFTESGPGAFRNGSSTFVAMTGADGTATAELQSVAGESNGTNTVTATITGFDTNNDGFVDQGRSAGTTDDECEQAAANTGGGTNNNPGGTAGNCADTATVVFGGTASPSPGTESPSPSPSPAECDVTPTVTLEFGTINATGSSGVTVNAPANSQIELLAYSQPSTTYRVVRRATINNEGDPAQFRIVPPTNTRLFAQIVGCDTDEVRFSKVLNVRTQLSLNVERLGTQRYRFFGDSLPARAGGLIVSLYRITDNGRQVLTAQDRANALGQARSGEWSIDRTFTGTGRFGFVVRTGQDLQNAPGSSNVRSLLIF